MPPPTNEPANWPESFQVSDPIRGAKARLASSAPAKLPTMASPNAVTITRPAVRRSRRSEARITSTIAYGIA